MIAKNQDTRLTYTANLASFDITFKTFEDESISVYVIEDSTGVETALTQDTHYTLSNIGVNGQDGQIDLVAGSFDWLDGSNNLNPLYSLVIEHDSNAFQPSFFRTLSSNSAITLEQVLDRLTMTTKAVYRDLVDAQGDLISQANSIAQNAADILVNAAAIVGLTTRTEELEAEVQSAKETISNGSFQDLDETLIEETEYDGVVIEYYAKRGARRQFGKVAMINESPFQIYQLEKHGAAGITFTARDVTTTGQIRAIADSSGDSTTFRYKISRYTL